jgi:hypothetical protein
MTKEFILKSLLPYKHNPEICGHNGSVCVYLTNDNKKCAIGQYMKEGEWQKSTEGVRVLFEEYLEEDIMTDEWCKENIPLKVAEAMQGYHDTFKVFTLLQEEYVDSLEKLTGFDLKELL